MALKYAKNCYFWHFQKLFICPVSNFFNRFDGKSDNLYKFQVLGDFN